MLRRSLLKSISTNLNRIQVPMKLYPMRINVVCMIKWASLETNNPKHKVILLLDFRISFVKVAQVVMEPNSMNLYLEILPNSLTWEVRNKCVDKIYT